MSKEILIVDDEKDICEVLDISVSDIGYKVYTANDGEEALNVFKDINPSIVLTDIRMPGIDGIELLNPLERFEGFLQVQRSRLVHCLCLLIGAQGGGPAIAQLVAARDHQGLG